MLEELRVENLLLMERAELRLAPGLNMLTGETGAGKTLLAHALDLLLGGRARRGIVRDGAAEAYVEGVFGVTASLRDSELIPDGAQEIVLARRVWPDGRTRAYVCGRSATVADLQELGGRLLSFYGQHEHRKLMLATAQLDLLDAYCGPSQRALRERVRAAYEEVRGLEARATELAQLGGARERELDLVSFELAEIEAADPSVEEEAALTSQRDRLRHLETLQAAAAAGAQAITPDGGVGVLELLSAAARELEQAASIDTELAELCTRLQALSYDAQDVGSELRGYLDRIAESDGAAGGLEEVEERLALFARLARKHGGGIEGVLAHAQRCRERAAELQNADAALEQVSVQLQEAVARRDELAAQLSSARHKAAPKLAKAVCERLVGLAMPDARFVIELAPRADGCGPRGADSIEMTIAANAGGAPGPLREVASGGELSRIMLALLSVAEGAGPAQSAGKASRVAKQSEGLLVFDEIDAGIGGHTARAVGEHLRALAEGRQILCITHLPQVAALAQRHFTIVKQAGTEPATTTVSTLDGDAVVGELVRMLGAGSDDTAAGEHARELLRAA